ncbi:MAG TPA: 7-cyano-7-deazaguanine synthase QueC [Candidatus Acidoferrales bacterium]|nr:7-cyano-7-deazaguanine synthase QueC [Candidatus Acidoferrales bacterium]
MTGKSKAVVLLSGGMDSCVTAGLAAQEHALALVHASYGQRTERRERRAFEAIADFYGVKDRLVARLEHLRTIGGSALTDPGLAVPERESWEKGKQQAAHGDGTGIREDKERQAGEGIPITYVPFRNAHFLSVAVSWAEALGAGSVWIGAVEEDSSGYPDCRPEYYRAFQEVVRAGTRPETRIEIVTPVIQMRKSDIIRRGVELGAPLHLTWSCYQGEEEACGVCESCLLRLRAFAETGVTDPIPYRAGVTR